MNADIPFVRADGSIDLFAVAQKASGIGKRICREAIPSFEVRHQTRGLYDVVHLLVYCPDFVGDMVIIENTVVALLKDFGWDPELPRVGAVVHMAGGDGFVNAMTYIIARLRLPHHSVWLSKDNGEAQEALDHELKQCTHAVEFTSRRMATQCYSQQSHFGELAYNHGLSYLKFVLNE